MKFYGEDSFNEQNSQDYNNSHYQNQQQSYGNQNHQNQQQYYNNTGYQDPMMDGKFHRPNFDNQPYNRDAFRFEEMRKYREQAQKNSSTPFGKFKGILFLVWFIGSIVASLVIINKTGQTAWAVVLFGQLFAGAGIMAFAKQKRKLENAIILILPIAGFIMVFGGLASIFGTQAFIEKLIELLPYIIMVFIFVIGLSFLIVTPIIEKKKRERCNAPVRAVVVDLIHSSSTGHKNTYAPVYEYYYNGKTYRERDSVFTNVGLPSVGQELQAYVNPEDPTDLYIISKSKNVINIVLGVLFVAFPVIILFLMHSANFA